MLVICCKSKGKDRKIFIFLKLLRNILQEIYDCSIRPKVCSIICVLISQKKAYYFIFPMNILKTPLNCFLTHLKVCSKNVYINFSKVCNGFVMDTKILGASRKFPKPRQSNSIIYFYILIFFRDIVSEREGFFKIPHKYALIWKIFLQRYFSLKQIKFPLHQCQCF